MKGGREGGREGRREGGGKNAGNKCTNGHGVSYQHTSSSLYTR